MYRLVQKKQKTEKLQASAAVWLFKYKQAGSTADGEKKAGGL